MAANKRHRQSKPKNERKSNAKRTPDRADSDHLDQEIVYGKHVADLMIEKNKINKVFVQKGFSNDRIKGMIDKAKHEGIVCQEVPKSKLDELTQGANHQGIVVTVPPYEYSTLADCFQNADQAGEPLFLLILDGIEDPHNLGSIIRTADAVGVHGIILPKRRAVGLTGVVAKTSTGALEHVPIVRVTNLVQTIEELKKQGVWVFATDMAGEDMRQWNSEGSIAIIIGNEGSGVSPVVKAAADGIVTIPMVGHVQSLNASVAAAILMYEVGRHRMPQLARSQDMN